MDEFAWLRKIAVIAIVVSGFAMIIGIGLPTFLSPMNNFEGFGDFTPVHVVLVLNAVFFGVMGFLIFNRFKPKE